MIMVFSPAVKKLNADTSLEASVSIGLYMTVIASILLLVAVREMSALTIVAHCLSCRLFFLGKAVHFKAVDRQRTSK